MANSALAIIEAMAEALVDRHLNAATIHPVDRALVAREWDARLTSVEPFDVVNNALVFFSGGGGGGTRGLCAGWVIDRLLSGLTPADILDRAREQIAANKITFWEITCVKGLMVKQREDLEPNVFLIPNAEVPSHYFADRVFGSQQFEFYQRSDDAALVQAFDVAPAFVPGDNRAEFDAASKRLSKARQKRAEVAVRIREALILSGSVAIEMSAGFDAAMEDSLFTLGFSMSSNPWPPHVPRAKEVDINATRRYLELLNTFGDSPALSLAIHRLGLARSGGDPVNRAIDLGLALEVALMSNDPSSQEIGNKLGTRCAWLTGASVEQRKEAFTTAGKLYTARSEAAHRGAITPKTQRAYNFAACNDLVRATLAKIVERGKFPDWRDLTLGGDGV